MLGCITIFAHWDAEGASPNTMISITRSEVCEKTGCIAIRDLIIHDNSTQGISGKFVQKGDDYARKPGLKNSLNYYSIFSGKVFVFVEPDSYTMARSKNIILVPSLGQFMDKGQKTKVSLDSFTDLRRTTEGVWVDPKCHTARVGVAQGVDLGAVISHLAGGCKGDLGNVREHITNKTKINYCGQECQHQKYMKEALEKSKRNLLGNKK